METTRLLICEEDRDVCSTLEDKLIASGFRVFAAQDAGEVMSGLELINPLCLVLGVNSPDHDGFWIAEQLRNGNSEIPIIFVAANRILECMERARQIPGPVDFIIDPFDPDVLVSHIHDSVDSVAA
jgi:DNA-binding response OmpR family regulator